MPASSSRNTDHVIELPPEFPDLLDDIRNSLVGVSGWLTHREMEFLALLAVCPLTKGEVLEIGCYHGKSTIALAKAVSLTNHPQMVTIDPIAKEKLPENLRRAGVEGNVEVHAELSTEAISRWTRPLRLLWHDGANDIETVRQDIDSLIPHLSDRAIVAMHDVLNPSGDRIRSFIEQILASDHFGPFGFCGSIGWAQYRTDTSATCSFAKAKNATIKKLKRLVPFHSYNRPEPTGLASLRYRLLRSRIPHAKVNPRTWLDRIVLSDPPSA